MADAQMPSAVWPAVLTAALDCIIVMDARGLVREFNPAAERTFGWSRAEAVGRPLSELIVPPELRARHNEGLRHYMRSGEGPVLGKRIEIEGTRKDGSRLPVELAIVPFDAGSERLFAGYLRDLSERVRSQRELQRRNDLAQLLRAIPLVASQASGLDDAVQHSLETVRAFMGWPLGHAYFVEADGNLASHGVWSSSDGERFRPFRAASEVTRFPPGIGLPGRVLADGKPVWIPDLNADTNFPRAQLVKDHGLQSAFGFPISVGGRVQIVLEFFSPTAAEPQTDVLAALESVGLELGRVLERLAQEAALGLANTRLQALVKSRQEFLNQAAHELGTPLTPVLTQLALLDREPLAHDIRHRIDIIKRNVGRLRVLALDLLDAARIDGNGLRVQATAMDLADIARAAVAAQADPAKQAGIALTAVATGAVPAHADAQRVAQVLDNLLSNALRFTDRGGRIDVLVHRDGPWAVAEVLDDGVGMSPAAMERLFQPFSQVHDPTTRSVGGTGLGLFICRGLAQANGGTLEATSLGLGRGSAFTLRLPGQAPG